MSVDYLVKQVNNTTLNEQRQVRLMDSNKQLPKHWDALVNIFRQASNSKKPILWVGAGLSVPAGLPTTDNLLKHLNATVPQQIFPFTPDDSTLLADNFQRSFSHWIQELINQNTEARVVDQLADIFLSFDKPPTLEQQSIVSLPWAAIYTTNYDDLLEQSLRHAQIKFRIYKERQNLGLERQNELPLYKIHGCISDVRNWTLGQESYEQFASIHPQLSNQLSQLYFKHPLVYIGCSMLDPRIVENYQIIIENGQLNLLQPAYVIIRKADWQILSKQTLDIYQQAKVRPILFDDFAELPGIVAKLKHFIVNKTMPTTSDIFEQNQHKREQREQNIIEELLIEKLAPQITTVIANIWLQAKPIDGYKKYVKNRFNAKTSHKVALAFGKIVGPIAELCELLHPHKITFTDKQNLFNQLTKLFTQTDINSELFERAKCSPETLVGSFIAIDKQVINKTIETIYQKALFNLSELLIDGIGALPNWNDDNLTALVSDEHDIFNQFNESLTRLTDGLSKVENQNDEIASTFRREVIRRYNQLRILGINFNSVSRYQLEVAYISLSLESESKSEILSTEQALTGFERLVILGDAGQGKTTLLQWLTVKCAQQSFNDERENNKAQWNQKVPILIKLREVLKRPQLPQINDLFALMDDSKPVTNEQQAWLANAITTKQAIFMVDGFDEVPLERRPDTLNWLDGLCEQYTGNHFILTSRPGAYDEGTLAELDFVELKLKTMNTKAQRQFINHWHHAVAVAEDDTRPTALDDISYELHEKLQEQPSLRTLAQNPLLCGVVCMLHRQRSGYLPQSKSELYKATSEMLLDTRDRERNMPEDESFGALDYTDKCNLLAYVAYWMTKHKLTSISVSRLFNRLDFKQSRMPLIRGKITTEDLCRFFIERSGLLLKVGDDEVQFAHRSFQEYFSAYQAVNIEQDWKTLGANAHQDFWHDTVIQAVGLSTAPNKAEQFLLRLLEKAKKIHDEKISTPLYLLVLVSSDGLRERSEKLELQIADILPAIVPPKNVKIRDALANAGSLALPFLKRTKPRRVTDDIYCAQALVQMHTPEAYRLLAPYFVDTRQSYYRKLYDIYKEMEKKLVEQAEFCKAVKHLALEQSHWQLLVKLAFIIQDADLALRAYNLAAKQDEVADFETAMVVGNTQHGFKPFTQLPSFVYLKDVNYSDCEITDIYPLTCLNSLYKLDLSINSIEDIEALTNFIQLDKLYLEHNQITNIEALANLTQLKELSLNGNDIKDYSHLKYLNKLRYLELPNVSEDTLKFIEGLVSKSCEIVRR